MAQLIGWLTTFASAFFGAIEKCFKLFFNDMPSLFGLKLGWWFILFGLLTLFLNFIFNG